MKASLATTLALSFTLFVANASAQSTDKPEVHVGDRWSMQHTNGLVNERDYTTIEDVVEITDKEIQTRIRTKGRSGSGIAAYTKEWNPVDVISARYDPNLGRFSFPLQVGKKWDGGADKMLFSNGKHGKFSLKGEVVSLEKVTVPAGTFDAYKVVLTVDAMATDEDANIGHTVETYWYAPSAKREIKSEYVFSKDGRVRSKDIFELLEYSLR